MKVTQAPLRLVSKSCRPSLSLRLALPCISRSVSSTPSRHATPTLHPTTRRDQPTQSAANQTTSLDVTAKGVEPSYKSMTPLERAQRTADRARSNMQKQLEQQQSGSRQLGGLVEDNLFTPTQDEITDAERVTKDSLGDLKLTERSIQQMSFALNPRPNARAMWQRKMLIRHIRHRGRLSRQVQIDRTERSHLSKSHFFKTSMKKLAPLARQISGKHIDEAILQMRFSKKKAAQDVRAHLIQARDEAIVIKGMGLSAVVEPVDPESQDNSSPVITDPAIEPPLPHQNPTKSNKPGTTRETDMYVAEAWVNRGPYGKEPESRARGRINILRPPWTGLSVLLKEEKTRTREKADKEEKSIRKRLGKNMWTQLPDRPVVKQSQYVLW